MTDFFNQTFYGNTFAEWLLALSIIAATFIVGRIIYWIFSRWIGALTRRTKTNLDDILIDMIEEPIVAVLVLWGIRYALGTLTLSESAKNTTENLFIFGVAVLIAWLAARVYEALHQKYLVVFAEKSPTDLDDQLLPVVRTSIKFIIFAMGILIGLNNAGYDVGAVLAGLGIGGLAFALAAQDTVSNIFGGITVFIQRPFKVNDRIRVAGVEGYIREIGLRSSTIETISRERILIPNKFFTNDAVYNLDVADYYFQSEVFKLHRETTSEQIEHVLDILREIGSSHEHLLWGESVVKDVTEYGVEVELLCGVKPWEQGQPFDQHLHKMAIVRSDINLQCVKKFEENNIRLALPVWSQPDRVGRGIYQV